MVAADAKSGTGDGSGQAHLVLIETLGNQAHVFASNKLREMLGASEQILHAGTTWVVEALGGNCAAADIGTWLNEPLKNPAFEAGGEFEVLVAASGKALVLTRGKDKALDLVRSISRRAQREAPGLQVLGAITPLASPDWTASGLHDAIRDVHKRHMKLRGEIGLSPARFLRPPVAADCASTGAGASGFDPADPEWKADTDPRPYSTATLKKRKWTKTSISRLNTIFSGRIDFTPERDYVDEDQASEAGEPGWWAVVHADGNGLGQVFMDFASLLPEKASARDYITAFRAFSLALDECTKRACADALEEAFPDCSEEDPAKLKPIVIAGDDLTVICDGRAALKFTAAFLAAFETHTECDAISSITAKSRDLAFHKGLTAAAGIAIVKPHHPFHRAYELAEELCASAKACKTAKTPVSALDFHVAFDQASDLDAVRARSRINGTLLWGGPYVTAEAPADIGNNRFLRNFGSLLAAAAALRETSSKPGQDSRAILGRSQQHDLREAIYLGPEPAELALQRLANRPEINQAFKRKLFGGTSPFDSRYQNSTLFLDAMDIAALEGTTE